MGKPKQMPYLDFQEYEQNDPNYLLKVLSDRLNDYQNKMVFRDGSTYHVTKAGSRYWEYFGYDGNQVGFKGELRDGRKYWYCSLDKQTYHNAGDFWQRVHFLTE